MEAEHARPAQTTLDRLATLLLDGAVEVVDCTSVLGPSTPLQSFPPEGSRQPSDVAIHKISEYDADGPFFAWNWLALAEHSGTHIEAPQAWISGRALADGFTDTLGVEKLAAPVCVVDCAREAEEDPGFLLTEAHLRDWESRHGPIEPGSWVVMRTDWDKRAGDKAAFLNGGRFPGPSAGAVRHLLTRDVVGWGGQCASIDHGEAAGFDPSWPAKQILLGAGKYGLASLARLDRLPPKGAILIAAPLKFVRGTGSPIRALALVPRGAAG